MRFLIIVIICLKSLVVFSSTNNFRVSYLSVKDGLSHNEVTSIVQDQYGFMWFGTRGGLNRYDGYEFKHFKPSTLDTTGISNPSIEALFLNSNDEICIGLKSSGPLRYINSQEVFKGFRQTMQYGLNRVLSFYEDSKGNLWIGSWDNGMVCINNDTIIHYKALGQIRDFAETEDGKIWIASSTGLKYIDESGKLLTISGKSITSISTDKQNKCIWALGWTQELLKVNNETLESKTYKNILTNNARNYSLLNDSKGRLWIGTWGEGFYYFDKEKELFNKIELYPEHAQAAHVDYRIIRDIYEDKRGDIWLATQAGIARISAKNNFNSVNIIDPGDQNISHINAVFVDDKGMTWAGTNGNGLFYSMDNKEFQRINSNYKLDNGTVKTISKGPDNRVWVCFEEGIFTIEKISGSFQSNTAKEFFQDDEFNQIRKVHQLFFDENKLWIGTQQRGVFLFEKQESKYRLIKNFISGDQEGMLGDNRVTAIRKDLSGNLWFATYQGLFQFNVHDSTFLSLSDLRISSALSCDIILCLEIDEKGNLWFGTPCSLHNIDFSDSDAPVLKTFNNSKGLADDYINGIVVDNNGMIWCSTNAGISSLNPENNQVLNYDKVDGIGDFSYSEGAHWKGAEGTIYFGGYTALTYFDSKKITSNNYQPPLVISDFKILNKELKVGDKENLLTLNINDLDELELSHNENEFTFTVASLDFKAPHKNQYAYRLIGYDSDWIELLNQREISFSNLKPDDYRLQIKGTNSNGIWSNNLKEIRITIIPAPWKSTYAIIAYVLFIMLIVFIIIRTALRQERLQGVIEMERVQSNQIKEINDYKLRFFTNISHEFRTPLTLILGPVKELNNKEFSEIKPGFFNERISMIAHNTKRLYHLVNQLLEFRKMESGKIELTVAEHNLVDLINENCTPFKQLARMQEVQFNVNYKARDKLVFIDADKLSVVLTNLLSNAFKHVSEEGEVAIDISDDDEFYTIDISNEGKEIPESEIKHLFERFYQVKGNSSLGSSGIGLQLVKAFTELHKGKVSVSSKEGKPVVFSVCLKKGKDHFSEEDLIVNSQSYTLKTELLLPLTKSSVNKASKEHSVLIVEDNAEVRQYLVQLFSENYKVFEATDGFQGFDKAIEFKPDLVLSDVMMPRMDGYELCEKIKSNDIIYDIPVVLLTAKGSDKEQLFGKQKGADLYIKKPFVPDLLLEEVKQLISSRNSLKEKYANKIVLEGEKEEISSAEALFLKSAIKVVDKHIKMPEFTHEVLANELAMSSSSFYRKIKKTTNLTPAGFIKSIRLKKAAQLLKDTDLTVSEIIEHVGYLDARSFRKSFKDQFGDTPTEYRNENA